VRSRSRPLPAASTTPEAWHSGRTELFYVAEAGEGGTDFCFDHGGFGHACAGMTGALTRLWNDKQERILRGLPSLADEFGSALGPNDVSPHGNGNL